MKKFILFALLVVLCAGTASAFELQANTAVTLKLGPFVDSTDGNTVEDGLTVSQADVRISKNGGDFAQKNEASACTHDELGYYDCVFDTTDTNTEGTLKIVIHESGALPVWLDCSVMAQAAYISKYTAKDSGYMDVNAKTLADDAITAAKIAENAIGASEIATSAIGSDEIAADAIGASEIAADAIATSELAATAVTEVVTGVWNAATVSYGGAGTYGQAVEDTLAAAEAMDTNAEVATAVWEAQTSGYGSAGTYGLAAESANTDALAAKTAAEKIDTNTELRTLLTGSDTAVSTLTAANIFATNLITGDNQNIDFGELMRLVGAFVTGETEGGGTGTLTIYKVDDDDKSDGAAITFTINTATGDRTDAALDGSDIGM